MNCDSTEKISLLIDDELSPAEARELERHLLSCIECQRAKVDFLDLRSQITKFPVSFKPAAQTEPLARILGQAKVVAKSSGSAWRWVFNPAIAAFASLLIVGAVIALLVYPRLKVNPNSTSEIAEKKRSPRPVASPSAGGNGGTNTPQGDAPKKVQPSTSGDKNKTPGKKRAPVVEPQPDFITENTSETQDSLNNSTHVRSADTETMTAIHLQKSEMLLRSFRNVRLNQPGMAAALGYEKKRAQQLVYQNMMLRREADTAGDAQVASLLESLEPILLDIANLSDKPRQAEVRVIKERVERKNIVALLQINSTALARALD
jgi:hypothetical protein